MGSFKHEECAKVIQCDVFSNHLAHGGKDSSCWEMARQAKDFRFLYNVCQDCIVYLFSRKENVFSKNEIRDIISKRNITCYHQGPSF